MIMANSKQSRVAFLTGAGPGLGASLVRRFAKEYAVAVNAGTESFVKSLGDEIRASGGTALEVPGDIGDRDQVADMFRSIRERLGPPDVLLYNAGSGAFGTVTEITPEQVEASWRGNGFGAFLLGAGWTGDRVSRWRGGVVFTGATPGVEAGGRLVAVGAGEVGVAGP